jgi:type I restriction enzyme S subunit
VVIAEAAELLPEGWTARRLREVARRAYGGGTPNTSVPEFWNGDIPWTTSAIISEQDIRLSRFQGKITAAGLEHSSSRIAPKGSVIVGTRVGVGKAVVADLDVAVNQDLTVIEPGEDIDAEYLAYCFKSPMVQRWFEDHKRGTTIKGVPRDDLLNLLLPVPPLEEQRAIAGVLSTIQRAIEATDKVIAATRKLKASLMRHLFTYGPVPVAEADTVDVMDTEIGPVPVHWRVCRLKDVCRLSTGTTPATDEASYWQGDVPFVKTAEIVNSRLGQAANFVSEEAVRRYHLTIYPPGTVFMAMYGQGKTRGQVALLDISAATSQNTAAIRPNTDMLTPEFLWLNLMGRYMELRTGGAQGHITHLNLGYVGELPIALPPLTEQRRICDALLAAEQKLQSELSRATAISSLFNSTLRDLMSGRVRALSDGSPQ